MSEGHDDAAGGDARPDPARPHSDLIPKLPEAWQPMAWRIRARLERWGGRMVRAGKNPWVLGPAAVLAIGFHSARVALDTGIAKIHGADETGFGVNSLNGGPDAVDEVLQTWRNGDIRLGDLLATDAMVFARYQTVLELLLVPFSLFVLWIIAWSQLGRVRRAAAEGDRPRAAVYISMLHAAIAGAVAYAALGVVNQLIELYLLAGYRSGLLEQVLWLSGSSRRLMLVLTLIPIAVTAVQLERWKEPGSRYRWWRGSGTAFRVLLLAVAVHSLLLLFSIPGEQAADAVRLWADRWQLAIVGLLTTALLSLVVATIAIRLGKRDAKRRVMTPGQTKVFVAWAAALCLVGVAFWRTGDAYGVIALGLILLGVSALSLPITRPFDAQVPNADDVAQPTDAARERLPALLATIPAVSLMVALLNAAIPSLMDGSLEQHERRWSLLYWAIAAAALAVAIAVAATWFTRWARDQDGEGRRIFTAITAGGGATAVVLAVWATRNAGERAPDLGVIALVAIFMTIVATLLGTVGYLLESRPLPAALDIVGFRRVPLVSGLIVWAFVANQFSPGGFHDVRTVDDDVPVAQESLSDAFDRWSAQHPPVEADADAPGEVIGQPLVLIATAGGGLKAATFTAAAVDCVFGATLSAQAISTAANFGVPDFCNDANRWSSVFVASGASGGSVGLASVHAESERRRMNKTSWVQDRLGADLLSPELAWQLFVEGPNALLAFNPAVDRAEVLERAWQRRFRVDGNDGGLAEQAFYRPVDPESPWEPLLYLSGTSLQDGCRVNISPIRSEIAENASIDTGDGDCTGRRLERGVGEQADTRELTDYLCGDNIDLAAAAFLSARFPYVSPVATQSCEVEGASRSLAIADGGYRDNSGAGSVLAAWQVLDDQIEEINASGERCIVPIVLEISSGYAGLEGGAAATDLAQVLAPAVGAANVFGDLSYGPIEELASEFDGDLAGVELSQTGTSDAVDRYFRLSLLDHPGVTAPLGWSLSDAAADDLADQLELAANRVVIDELTALLEPAALRCTPPSPIDEG